MLIESVGCAIFDGNLPRGVRCQAAGVSVVSIGPPPRDLQPVESSHVAGVATTGPSRLSGGSNPRRQSSLLQPSKYQAEE
jgi:hypothetical protein